MSDADELVRLLGDITSGDSVIKLAPSSSMTLEGKELPKPKRNQLELETGFSYYLPFIQPFQQSYEMMRDDELTTHELQAMRKTDGQARALYRLITLPIRAALKNSTFVPVKGVAGGKKEAEFVRQMLTLPSSAGGMTVPLSKVIAQLLQAIFDGFSAFEMVYWVPKRGPLKGKWTLKKIAHRPSNTLTFLIDKHGSWDGFRQRTVWRGESIDVQIPAEHSLYYAANEEERPFYGVSYFQSAFYHWDKKVKLYYIAHLAAQISAVGTRVGTMPVDSSDIERAAFSKALRDVGVAHYMRMPEGFKVEVLKEGGNFDFLNFVNHHNSQMSKSILAIFFSVSNMNSSVTVRV